MTLQHTSTPIPTRRSISSFCTTNCTCCTNYLNFVKDLERNSKKTIRVKGNKKKIFGELISGNLDSTQNNFSCLISFNLRVLIAKLKKYNLFKK